MPDVKYPGRIPLHEVEPVSPQHTLPAALQEFPEGTLGPGARVTLQFSLQLENGEIIDSNMDKESVTFTIGDGSLLPGFEQAMFGLAAGASQTFILAPEQAFGQSNEDNVQGFPRYQFPPDMVLSKGLVIDFADVAGNAQAGVVTKFDASRVDVDFNHPLAGRHIQFTVRIHAVTTQKERGS